jgi:hypothetical protein
MPKITNAGKTKTQIEDEKVAAYFRKEKERQEAVV